MHHAFDPRVLDHINVDRDQDIPFSFVGQLSRSPGFHEERIRQLERIANAMEITIFSPGYGFSRLPRVPLISDAGYHLARMFTSTRGAGRAVERLILSEKLRSSIRPPVFGLAMYQTLQRSQITYNSHIDISSNSASNRRLFECTGVGSCLLTDYKANISDLFEPDREVVTFSSTDECIEKARWLLAHPHERREIARAGQRRTLADHTFTQRASQFDAVIQEVLEGWGSARPSG